MTAPEAAEYLGMTYGAFRRIMHQIPHKRTGARGWHKFRTRDLDTWDRHSTIYPEISPRGGDQADRQLLPAFAGPIDETECPDWE